MASKLLVREMARGKGEGSENQSASSSGILQDKPRDNEDLLLQILLALDQQTANLDAVQWSSIK